MKKYLCILLSLVMIFSSVPAAFAEDTADEIVLQPEEVVLQPETENNPVIEDSEKTVIEQEDGTAPESREIVVEQGDDAVFLQKEAAEDELQLFGSNTLTVTVNLPQGAEVTEFSNLHVYLYKAAKTDSSGKIVDYGYVDSDGVIFLPGNTSNYVSFTDLPDGEYVVNLYTAGSDVGGISGIKSGDFYYNGDGTISSSYYAAEGFAVNGDVNMTLTLPAPERTISGTLNFSSAVSKTTTLSYWFCPQGSEGGASADGRITVKQGASSADFTVDVDKAAYTLWFYGLDGNDYVLDINGSLFNADSYDEKDFLYANTVIGSVSGIEVDADVLLTGESSGSGGGGSGSAPSYSVNVTVNLPETLTSNHYYRVYVIAESGKNTDGSVYPYYVKSASSGAGENSFSCTFDVSADEKYYFAYTDITNIYTFGNGGNVYLRYASENGVSGGKNAKLFSFTSSGESLVINDTSNSKITGTVSTEGVTYSNDMTLYVAAEFENGESYFGNATIFAGSSSAEYAIYVPTVQSGNKYSIVVYKTRWNSSNIYEPGSGTEKISNATFSGSVSDVNLVALNRASTVSGTIYFTNPLSENVAIYVGADSTNHGLYLVKKGSSSFTYSFCMPYESSITSNAYVEGDVYSISEGDYEDYEADVNGNYTNVNYVINNDEAQPDTISGTIKLPEELAGDTVTLRITESGYLNYYCTYVTIMKGKNSVDYSIPNYGSGSMEISVLGDTDGTLVYGTYYLTSDLSFSSTYEKFTKSGSLSNVDLTLQKGYIISGTISLALGLKADTFNIRMSADSVEGNTYIEKSFSFTGTETEYKIAVPDQGKYVISVTVESANDPDNEVLTETVLYYSASGVVFSYSNKNAVTAPAEDIDFIIPQAYLIPFSLILDSGLPTDRYIIQIFAEKTDADIQIRKSIRLQSASGGYNMTGNIGVPLEGDYLVSVRVANTNYQSNPVIKNTFLYYTGSAQSTNAKDALPVTAPSSTAIPLKVLAGVPINLQFSLDKGLEEDNFWGVVNFYDSGKNCVLSTSFDIYEEDEIVNASLLSAGDYYVGIYVYAAEQQNSTVLRNTEYYIGADGFVDDIDDAQLQTLTSGSTVNCLIRKKSGIKVNINLNPELTAGKYWGYIKAEKNDGPSNSYYFEFDGKQSGTSVVINCNEGDVLTLSYYLYGGADSKIITDTSYYYTGEGSACSEDFEDAAPVSCTGGDLTVNMTINRAKLISGSLYAVDGSEIVINDDSNIWIEVLDEYESSVRDANVALDKNASFAIAVPESLTGDFILRVYGLESVGNICVSDGSCLYNDGGSGSQVVKSSNEATPFNLTDSDYSGITVPVETGWVVSGSLIYPAGSSIELDEGCDYVDYSVVACNTDYDWFYGKGRIYSDGSNYYSLVLPKVTEATYSITRDIIVEDSIETDLCLGSEETKEDVCISGDCTLNFNLEKAGYVIRGTITRPEGSIGGHHISAIVTVGTNLKDGCITDGIEYSYSGYYSYRGSSFEYSIKIPESCAVTYYSVAYHGYGTCYHKGYMKADGTMSINPKDQAVFTWSASQDNTVVKIFSVIPLEPCVSGKIYIPDGVNGSFSVRFYRMNSYWSERYFTTEDAKTDSKGRRYVEYDLEDADCNIPNYIFSYYVTSDSTNKLRIGERNTVYYSDTEGWLSNGEAATELSAYSVYNIDITLYLATDPIEKVVFESAHGLSDSDMHEYKFTYPSDVESVTLYFSKYSDCDVYIGENIYNASFYDYYGLRDGWSITIGRNDFSIFFSPGGSLSYGFAITSIDLNYAPKTTEEREIVAIYSMDDAEVIDNKTPLECVQSGKDIKVQLRNDDVNTQEEMSVYGVVYGENGYFIKAVLVTVMIDGNGNYTANFDFGSVPDAKELKIFFVDSDGKPVCLNYAS